MAVVYSMKTAQSLLGRIAATGAVQKPAHNLLFTSIGGGYSIVLPWLDAAGWGALPPERRRIWKAALSHPYGRFNYLSHEVSDVHKHLAIRYDVESLNLLELVQLGQHAVECGLLSVAEYSILLTTSRIEEKFDVATGTPTLAERDPNVKFNLYTLWQKRLKILRRIRNSEFESTEDILRVLHSLSEARDEIHGL